jgi:hypothetical protein
VLDDCVVELLLESVAALDARYRSFRRGVSGGHGGGAHDCKNHRDGCYETAHLFLGAG